MSESKQFRLQMQVHAQSLPVLEIEFGMPLAKRGNLVLV